MLVTSVKHQFKLERRRNETDSDWGERIGAVVQWCIARHSGPGFLSEDNGHKLIVGSDYTFSGVMFFFANENDAVEFKMRWV